MGMMVIPISHGVTYKLPITAVNTAVFYRGNFTKKSPEKNDEEDPFLIYASQKRNFKLQTADDPTE